MILNGRACAPKKKARKISKHLKLSGLDFNFRHSVVVYRSVYFSSLMRNMGRGRPIDDATAARLILNPVKLRLANRAGYAD